MSGTFSSFGSALSALRYNRVAMDVASNNIANAHTTGYTRRAAIAQATGAPDVPALWSRWNGTSGGVEVGGIERIVDPLLDARSRTEHASLSFLDARAASLVRFETTLGEPGENGIAAALSAFKQGWGDVANNPADGAARSQLIGRATTLQAAVGAQANAVATEWSDQRARLVATIEETNKIAADLAKLNGALQSAAISGNDAGTLLDQRDQLALRLSELTGAKAVPTTDNRFNIELDGVLLVDGTTAGRLSLDAPATMPGATPDTTKVQITATDGSTQELGAVTGRLGGVRDVMNRDLPAYVGRLDAFVATLTQEVNGLHQAGYDLQDPPQPGKAFFGGTTAATLTVLVQDPTQVAAAGKDMGRLDASVAQRLGAADLGSSAYRSLVTDFGVQVASARRVAANQGVLTSQVDASRESLSGVNIDEEMVNLLAAQRAYEGAARVITTLDSVLETLINRTGLTR